MTFGKIKKISVNKKRLTMSRLDSFRAKLREIKESAKDKYQTAKYEVKSSLEKNDPIQFNQYDEHTIIFPLKINEKWVVPEDSSFAYHYSSFIQPDEMSIVKKNPSGYYELMKPNNNSIWSENIINSYTVDENTKEPIERLFNFLNSRYKFCNNVKRQKELIWFLINWLNGFDKIEDFNVNIQRFIVTFNKKSYDTNSTFDYASKLIHIGILV